jgi:hypothetical protein
MAEFLDKAITAHSAWKMRLRDAINGTQTVDPTAVAKDSLCDLGKWIHGDGCAHNSRSEFQALKTRHAEFHVCAGKIAQMVKDGKKMDAEKALDGPEFAGASTKVVAAIGALKKIV